MKEKRGRGELRDGIQRGRGISSVANTVHVGSAGPPGLGTSGGNGLIRRGIRSTGCSSLCSRRESHAELTHLLVKIRKSEIADSTKMREDTKGSKSDPRPDSFQNHWWFFTHYVSHFASVYKSHIGEEGPPFLLFVVFGSRLFFVFVVCF